jgi:hypothetical protein
MNLFTIDESQWKLDRDGHKVTGLLTDQIIYRKINNINIKELSDLEAVLRFRISVKNPDDGKRYYTVENPLVDGVEQKGVWYGVSVNGVVNPTLGPAGTLQQVLALWKGDLNTVWSETKTNPSFAAEQVIDSFSHIPLANLATLKTALGTATSGYKVSEIREKKIEDGGYGELTQVQDKVFVGTVTADNGTLTQAEYLPLLTNGVFRTTAWIGVPDASLTAAMETLATPPSGYFIRTLVNNYNGTGSCTIVRTMGPAGPYDPTPQAVQFPGFDDERRTYWHCGYTAAEAEVKRVELLDACDAGYKVDSVELREYRWETVLIVQQISKLNLALTGTVQVSDYTRLFGLVTHAITTYPNVAKDSIAAVKATIIADTTKLILNLKDDDVGQGKANITCVWRSKEATPTALGSIQSSRPSAFHQTTQERKWININLTTATALSDAVALALAGTTPYAVATDDTIHAANGEDAGDKTGVVTQRVSVKPSSYTPAEYSLQESFNPHGWNEAVMVISVKEYPEVAYADLATVFGTLQTFLGNPMKGRIQVSMNVGGSGSGTFSMRGMKEGTPDWSNTTPTYKFVGNKNKDAIGEQEFYLATGVPIANATAILAAAVASEGYALDDVRIVERGNGEAGVEAVQTLKSESAIIVRDIPARGSQRGTQERIWPLVLHSNFDTVWASVLTTGVTGNYILDFRQADLTGNGMWRMSSIVVNCAPTTLIDNKVVAYTDDSTTHLTQVQDAASIPALSDTAGTSQRLTSLDYNRFGRYDYVKHTVTSRVPKSCASVTYWTTYGDTYWVVRYSLSSGLVDGAVQWQVSFVNYIAFFTTAAEATGYLNATPGAWLGSCPNKVGDNLWMAHKIVKSDNLTGASVNF